MDWLLTLWMVCLTSPLLAWTYRRVRLRSKKPRSARSERSEFVPRMTRDQQPLERLVADLTRLEREFARLENSDAMNKMMRMQSVSLAYDDVLCECCAALGLPAPQSRPLGSVDRMQTECDLVRHGLAW
ncbi:MAG: hypothetical protein WA962_05865 [Ornithinimicrobium sp.]